LNETSNRGGLHRRALDTSVFADAPPLERATLEVVALTIEIERERLRPELGKGGYHPSLIFHAG
jgi:hypothetical protein